MRLWPMANIPHMSTNTGMRAPKAKKLTAAASASPQKFKTFAGSSRKARSALGPNANSDTMLAAAIPAKKNPRPPGPSPQRTSRNVDKKVPRGTMRMPTAR